MKRRGVPYRNKKDVYDIACGLEGDKEFYPRGLENGDITPLLSPNRAIYSAICSVLALERDEDKERLLGKEAYEEAKRYEERFDEGDYAFFVDVGREVMGAIKYPDNEAYNKFKQLREKGEVSDVFILFLPRKTYHELTEEERVEKIKKYVDESRERGVYESVKRGFVAAKLRRVHFPTTPEFEKRHNEHLRVVF